LQGFVLLAKVVAVPVPSTILQNHVGDKFVAGEGKPKRLHRRFNKIFKGRANY
jgi:hypothetical protein